MEWCKTLKKSFIFSIDTKRWLPVFAADIFFVLLVLLSIFWLGGISNYSIMLIFLEIFIIVITYSLAKIWIKGAIVHQSYKEKDKVKESFKLSYNKYFSLLGAAIIVMIISGIVSMVPVVGVIFSILVSLIFFFIYQGVIVKDFKFNETLEHSYNIFKKNWSSVIGIFLVLLLTTGLIMLVFLIPLISVFIHYLVGLSSIENIINAITSNPIPLIVTGILGLIGFSIGQVFNSKAQTEFYLQLTKKTAANKNAKKSVKKTPRKTKTKKSSSRKSTHKTK